MSNKNHETAEVIAKRAIEFWEGPLAERWGIDSPATMRFESSSHTRSGWRVIDGTDGRLTYKSGFDFRSALDYLFVRLDGRLIIDLWPPDGARGGWLTDHLAAGHVVTEYHTKHVFNVGDLVSTPRGARPGSTHGVEYAGTPRGRRFLESLSHLSAAERWGACAEAHYSRDPEKRMTERTAA